MSSKAVTKSSKRLQLKALKKTNPQGKDNFGGLESTFSVMVTVKNGSKRYKTTLMHIGM